MKGKSIYKVPDGKLLKVSLETDGDKIKSIMITGDFFMHPETGIELIESKLKGQNIGDEIVGVIDKAVEANSIEMFGLDSKALLEAIKMAKEAAK
ncbi:MAG: hypothetical protein CL943_02635 [Candidatus Diapherotrites archaeon]|uniref:Uncharacterized protein n=1 Tax=Candidatus Iainarchaeum sp. TaxID=3101447 RepID=A0A2D6M175_9ARCH|nr:hypothetical protein [Candidatus Diapherotrites archaeon]|tara:strand:+ start:3494 stop:3778 length:285 start_codon:yes stop_codon:yes gene_type:complete